ncbi:MAG: hypothetical protein L0215_04180 [Gemmataceae bacterium]|nr:hypothetical protein [Gemmataceae bacterium]
MKHWKICLATIAVALLAGVVPARALVVAPPPGPTRVAQADVIVVGRVVAHEPKDIEVMIGPGAKQTYRVAIVNITEIVRGAKELKSVRVGFIPPPPNDPNQPPIIRPRPFGRNVQLNVGQDGLFFLTKAAQKDLYTAPMYYDVVAGEDGNFKKEVDEAKQASKRLDNPTEGLKSANAEERFQTAALLVAYYRNPRNQGGKTEAVDAEQSKLILKAIADGNWNAPQRFGAQHPWMVFNQLGLAKKDGWMQPRNVKTVQDLHRAAQEWLRANLDSYRVQRLLPREVAQQ